MLTSRQATAADHSSFAHLFPELKIDDPLPDLAAWEAMVPHSIFVESDGVVAGYGMVRIYGERGHVVHVIADPAQRGRGVGPAIMYALAKKLREASCSEWYLNVKPDNKPAMRLYEKFGMSRRHGSLALELQWTDVEKLPHVTGDRELPDDETIETTFGLATGQVASLRARNYKLLSVSESGTLQAFAGFDPTVPGAAPFRAKRPEFARDLLEQMRADGRQDYTRLFIENDRALAKALSQAGATVKLAIEQWAGAIPPDASQPVEVVIFVGLQASGKSTCFHEHFAATHAHISKDRMPNNSHPQRRQMQLLDDALTQRKSVVVDNVNPTFEDRQVLIQLARRHGARIGCIHFRAPFAVCAERNALRDEKKRVPEVGLKVASAKLQVPTRAEGFDWVEER